MTTTLADDPVLVRFRKAPDEMDGSQIERVVLFGSRARGGARPDSDYDVAVFLTDPGELGTISAICHTLPRRSSTTLAR
jgi:predicted nucleotidyltransferase